MECGNGTQTHQRTCVPRKQRARLDFSTIKCTGALSETKVCKLTEFASISWSDEGNLPEMNVADKNLPF